ncbi:MAG TPA: methyltransferase domain-containing protein [Terriglobales bacterium]|jgi:ubiquinone/menaquinone biosynthesis C-methylase UbiE|nr:methyltransferase domain-containing protein [Terriglobales bacterium]
MPAVQQVSSAQRLVDTYFGTSAPYWRDVYGGETVSATIYRERRDVVLRWVDELGSDAGERALDIGCGAGSFSVALAKRGFQVRAIDPVPDMLKQTSQLVRERGVEHRVAVESGDAHDLIYPDNSFGLVLAIGVTPWLHSLPSALQEITRVLKPGGYVVISADNALRLNYWLDPRFCPGHATIRSGVGKLLRRLGCWREPHASTYSVRSFDHALKRASLEKIHCTTVGFGPFTFFEHELLSDSIGVALHHRLKKFVTNKPVLRSSGSQYLVLARKADASNSSPA